MSASGISSGVGGYDTALLPRREDSFEREEQQLQERDTVATRVAAMFGPNVRPDASPVDRSEAIENAPFDAQNATYGRRAPTRPTAAVGQTLDVTG